MQQEGDHELFSRYLDLLGAPRRRPGYDALRELTFAQLTHIPFENISKLHRRRDPGRRGLPNLQDFLDGIERHHFGGTCYPINFHLHGLLADLGYDVKLCGADMSAPDVHLVNVVTLDGRPHLVDGGYAAPFLEPIPLDLDRDHTIVWGAERYVVRRRDARARSRIERHAGGGVVHAYVVNPTPRRIEEFAGVIADSYSDDATFMHALLLVRFRATSSVTLRNLTLVTVDGASSRVTRLSGIDEVPGVVEREFRIPAGLVRRALDGVELTKQP